MEKEIAVIGGGIAGLGIALGLQNKGISCTVYEAAPQLKPIGAGIALSFNAVRACEKLGIRSEIRQAGHPLENAWITNHAGELLSSISYAKYLHLFKEASVMLHRHDLHQVLLNKLTEQRIVLGKRLRSFETENSKTQLHFEDGSTAEADYVIAADGIHSLFRKKLVPGSLPRYSGYSCWRGVGTLPADYPHRDAFIESWGKGCRMGIVPLKDNGVYWYGVKKAPQNDSRMKNATKDDILGFFGDWNPQYLSVLQNIEPGHLLWNDISDIDPLQRFAFGPIVLTGDAAHATTPNLGQGGSQALEDAVVLSECLAKEADVEKAFQIFEHVRLARTTRVINTSRTMGTIGQLENGILASVRNFLMRLTPEKIAIKQVEWLTQTPF